MRQANYLLIMLLLFLPQVLLAETELENSRSQVVELEAENQQLRKKLDELEQAMRELQQQIDEHAVSEPLAESPED